MIHNPNSRSNNPIHNRIKDAFLYEEQTENTQNQIKEVVHDYRQSVEIAKQEREAEREKQNQQIKERRGIHVSK